jgi:predicted RNA methylase
VLEASGGVRKSDAFLFDYDARDVINQIITSGCIPDRASHQFYPTPAELAQKAVEMAEITDSDTCLEPSAGTGGLADFMPKDQTLCVEISRLHCDVLEKKGFEVVCNDFLEFRKGKYSVICINPPFADGRAKAHVEHALTMLAPKGRLVAILPASFKGKPFKSGGKETWTNSIDNAFKNASVSVIIYKFENN